MGIINKMFGKSDVSTEVNAMMLTVSVIIAILFTIVVFLFNKVTGKPTPTIQKDAWFYAIICGIASCLYQRMNVMLAKETISVK